MENKLKNFLKSEKTKTVREEFYNLIKNNPGKTGKELLKLMRITTPGMESSSSSGRISELKKAGLIFSKEIWAENEDGNIKIKKGKMSPATGKPVSVYFINPELKFHAGQAVFAALNKNKTKAKSLRKIDKAIKAAHNLIFNLYYINGTEKELVVNRLTKTIFAAKESNDEKLLKDAIKNTIALLKSANNEQYNELINKHLKNNEPNKTKKAS